MPEYVYALHDFAPEHEDEIAFKAGEPIEVTEKDDQYNDGWWQGINIAGKLGLFPQSYTTPAPPPGGISASSSASSNDPITPPSDSLSPLHEEPESASSRDAESDSRIGIAIGGPESHDSEVMKATMTDVQKAIEQLGRDDRDGAQSFSFASTRDGDTDRETDGTETDGEIGEGWHRSARDKLAEQARKVVEAQAAQEAIEAREVHERTTAPPIDVEMSDESEAEEDDTTFQHLQRMHLTRDHPHIPEEEEEGDARRASDVRSHRRNKSSDTSSALPLKIDRSALQEANRERTSTATRSSFTIPSSSPRSTRSPIPNDRRSPRLRSAPTTPDAVNIVAPVPIVPMGVHMIPMSTSPEPAPRATTPNITPALPSPGLSVSGNRQHSRQPSQHNSISSAGKGSRVSAQSVPETEAQKKSTSPSEWTVDEVVDWLKSKGFGPDVYDKFIEQEITGDVLLELDINLLKVEIGIVAFGKRMRIANAIAELRRPPSIILGDHPQQSQTITQPPVSPSFSYPHSPSGSTQHSLNSPMFTSMGSTLNGPPSSTLAGPGSLESPKADGFTSPLITKRVSSLSSAGVSVNGGGSVEGASVATAVERAALIGAAGLGLGVVAEGQLTSSPSEGGFATPDARPEETAEEEQAQSESETEQMSGKQHVRRLFGRSADSSLSGKDREGSETPHGPKHSPSPVRTASPNIKRRDSQEESNGSVKARHSRLKRTTDVSKSTERYSLFGGTFSGTIGRTRKPPPRVTSTLLEDSSPTEKTSGLGLSRLYSSRKSSGRPSTSDGSAASSLRNGLRSVSESDAKKRETERSKSIDKTRDQERETPRARPTELNDGPPPRKQTATPQDGRGGARGPNALKPGKSIVEQIGHPDHQGWMRKKGDHYNSWKMRYFIIKGPHLYVLRSNSKAETKIKGYVNIEGYKVVADENVDPGRYGFRIVHDTDKMHCFSSDEQAVVREWMKAIMKATIGRDYSKPVISSVNIPTIPLTVAQAMNPAPRPPSPTARAAMQKALRRENPNQLSTRDARILMGLPSADNAGRGSQESERVKHETFFANPSAGENGMATRTYKTAPPRPSREARRISAHDLLERASDSNLVEWANSHLPRSLQMTHPAAPLFGGLALLRLAEDMMGKSATPPIPDSAFPSGPNDDKLDGLFRLFDFLLDNDVKMGSVSINDVRQGKRDKVMHLIKALKAWEDRRREIVKSLGQGAIPSIPTMGPVMGNSWR